MPPKKKRNVVPDKGPMNYNIVGVNHGVCLALMYTEGWKHETFVDVTFYCKHSQTTEPRKQLRANRSVLAAASPFFASVLPQGELETDICVTVEVSYQDMFSVLDYIYSGNILCDLNEKEHLLHILKEFQICLPDQKPHPRSPTKVPTPITTPLLLSAAAEPTGTHDPPAPTLLTTLSLSAAAEPTKTTEPPAPIPMDLGLSLQFVPLQETFHYDNSSNQSNAIETPPSPIEPEPPSVQSSAIAITSPIQSTTLESDPKLASDVRVSIPRLSAEELLGEDFSITTPSRNVSKRSSGKPGSISPPKVVSITSPKTSTKPVFKPRLVFTQPSEKLSPKKGNKTPPKSTPPRNPESTGTSPGINAEHSEMSPQKANSKPAEASPEFNVEPNRKSPSKKSDQPPPELNVESSGKLSSKRTKKPPPPPFLEFDVEPMEELPPKKTNNKPRPATPEISVEPSNPPPASPEFEVEPTEEVSQRKTVSPEYNVVIQRVSQALQLKSPAIGRDPSTNLQAIRLDANSDFVLWVAPPDESLTIAPPTDKDAVTYKSISDNDPEAIYPLSRYHSDTWCHGIFSPFEYRTPVPYIQLGRTEQEIQELSKDRRLPQWTLKPPNLLLEKPEIIYARKRKRRDSSHGSPAKAKRSRLHLAEKLSATKKLNGKKHVVLQGEPLPRPATLPNIFNYKDVELPKEPVEISKEPVEVTKEPVVVPAPEGFHLPADTLMTEFVLIDNPEIEEGEITQENPLLMQKQGPEVVDESNNEGDESCCVELEVDLLNPDTEDTHQDMVDLAMAKHFVEEESRRKNGLQNRIRGINESLAKHKKVAKDLLKAKEERELRIVEATFQIEDPLFKPRTKKRGPFEKCDQCGKLIAQDYMKHHKKLHNSTKSHLCEQCGRSFLVKAYLNNHIRINHSGRRTKNYMCSRCGSRFPDRYKLEKHELTHTDVKPFECQYCDKTFREKGTLTRHIRTHTGERPYSCNICGASFRARFTYNEHYKKLHLNAAIGSDDPREVDHHSNHLVYRCEHCDKTFHRLLTFEKHKATHTGAPVSLRCVQQDCDFTYSTMAEIKEHLAAAHPSQSYPCSMCPKIFLSKISLRNHMAKHVPNKGFPCSQCDAVMTTKSSLNTHEKIHNRKEDHECPTCGFRIHSAFLLRRHMAIHKPNYRKRSRNPKKMGPEAEEQKRQEEVIILEQEQQELVDESGSDDSNPPDVIVEFY